MTRMAGISIFKVSEAVFDSSFFKNRYWTSFFEFMFYDMKQKF